MLKVFKYPVLAQDYFTLDLPADAQILSIAMQHGEPQLWALVNQDAPTCKRRFRFAGTGHPIKESPDQLKYVSTFQASGGGIDFPHF